MSLIKTISLRALDKAAKRINPTQHAIADFVLLGSALTGAAVMYRRNPAAAAASLVLAAAEAAAMAVTDYPAGGGMVSFPMHGRMSLAISGLAASMPEAMGFGSAAEKKFFYAQAAAMVALIALTDYTGTRSPGQVKRVVEHAEV
jgi:hypothetical protein